jgi:hypothetical protein
LTQLIVIIPVEKSAKNIRISNDENIDFYEYITLKNDSKSNFITTPSSTTKPFETSESFEDNKFTNVESYSSEQTNKVNEKIASNKKSSVQTINKIDNEKLDENKVKDKRPLQDEEKIHGQYFIFPSLLLDQKYNFKGVYNKNDSIRIMKKIIFKRFITSGIVPRIIASINKKYGFFFVNTSSITDDKKDEKNINYTSYADNNNKDTNNERVTIIKHNNKCWRSSFTQEFKNCDMSVHFCYENIKHKSANKSATLIQKKTFNSDDNVGTDLQFIKNCTFFNDTKTIDYETSSNATTVTNKNTDNNTIIELSEKSYANSHDEFSTTQSVLRISSSGHLLQMHTLVEALNDYTNIVDEILNEYNGLNTVSTEVICPICIMKQLPEEECGTVSYAEEERIGNLLYNEIEKIEAEHEFDSSVDDNTTKTDQNDDDDCDDDVDEEDASQVESMEEKMLVVYNKWLKNNYIICNRHKCKIKPDLIIPLPENLLKVVSKNISEYHASIVSYLINDVINNSNYNNNNINNNKCNNNINNDIKYNSYNDITNINHDDNNANNFKSKKCSNNNRIYDDTYPNNDEKKKKFLNKNNSHKKAIVQILPLKVKNNVVDDIQNFVISANDKYVQKNDSFVNNILDIGYLLEATAIFLQIRSGICIKFDTLLPKSYENIILDFKISNYETLPNVLTVFVEKLEKLKYLKDDDKGANEHSNFDYFLIGGFENYITYSIFIFN